MLKDKLTIGQMARLNHLSPSTLRYYESMGLVLPAYTDPVTGYRYYDVTQSAVIRVIQYSLKLECSIKEIQQIFITGDFHVLEKIYREKLKEIMDDLQQLSRKKHALYKSLCVLEHFGNLPPAGTFTLEFLRTENVYRKPARRNYFQEDFGSFMCAILNMTEDLEKNNISPWDQYFHGFTMRMEDFISGRYQAADVEAYVDAAYAGHPHMQEEKGCLCACIYVDDFSRLTETLQLLKGYCDKNHCLIKGDVVCRLLRTLLWTDFRQPSPFLRLQVPVSIDCPEYSNENTVKNK